MKKRPLMTWLSVPVAAWLALAPAPAPAKDSTSPDLNKKLSELFEAPDATQRLENESVRYIPGPEQSLVQTPCYRFVDSQGRKLELTGAVHIGEKSYYDALNRHFETFDAVLFEMVSDADGVQRLRSTAPGQLPKEKKEEGLSALYRVIAHDLLNLSLQSDTIDYRGPNFVHADVSEKELDAMLKEHNLTFEELLAAQTKGLKIDLDQAAKLLPLLKFLVPKDDPKALMRMLAPTIAKMESSEGKEGNAFEEIIITHRNARALEVLDQQLAAGKKNLSLFYGSGHFADLRKRLVAKGWKEQGCEWRDAWIIPAKPAVSTASTTPSAEDAQKKTAQEAPADPAAMKLLDDAFKPVADAKTIRFTSTTTVNVDMFGQKQTQESVIEV